MMIHTTWRVAAHKNLATKKQLMIFVGLWLFRCQFLQADCGPESAWLSVAIFCGRGYFWAVAIFSWHLSTYRKRIKKYLRGYFLLVCVAIFRGYPWQ